MRRSKFLITMSNLWHEVDVDRVDHSKLDELTPEITSISKEDRANPDIQFHIRLNPLSFVQHLSEWDAESLLRCLAEHIGFDESYKYIEDQQEEVQNES